MPERDYPKGHPAASDYAGEPYKPRFNTTYVDFPEGHPAKGGHNVRPINTPDGMRAAHLEQAQDLQELAAVGSLPPVMDPETNKPLELTAEQLAYIYAVRQGVGDALAQEITARYHLTPIDDSKREKGAPVVTARDQALAHIRGLGFSPEAAENILLKYGIPDIMLDRESALHR